MSTVCFALCLSFLVPQEVDRSALAAVVDPFLADSGVPGAVVAVVVDGRPVRIEAFGVADLASGRRMSPETRFQVGSVTKPVTATLLARLAEEDVLSLDDSLEDHLGEGVPAELRPITLRQLASHTSGLPREPINRRNLPDSPSVMVPMSTEELLDGLDRTSLEHPPGANVAYSNLGFAVLGAVAESATGQPYHELAQEYVLTPLQMDASVVHVGDDPPDGLASCYWPEDSESFPREPWRFGTACAFSGLVSTGGDLARFLSAQLVQGDDAFLSAESRADLHRPVHQADPRQGLSMAIGWFVFAMPGGGSAVAHGGEVDGHSAMVAFYPELRGGLVVLCNRGDDAAEMLSRRLAGVVLPILSRSGTSARPAIRRSGPRWPE